ncbi:MAG: sugar phosphate isomerase/epimerase, partial [Gemmatimonadota bacterium]
MTGPLSRRDFLAAGGRSLAGLAAAGTLTHRDLVAAAPRAPLFQISLAQWSLHRALGAGEVNHLDFARIAREDYGIVAIEYVNSFFKDKATDAAYLAEMNQRAADQDVFQHLIMCDG